MEVCRRFNSELGQTICVLNMSDDDRAAKAARAKALVRNPYFKIPCITSHSRSLTKRGSKRNLEVQASQRRQHQPRHWLEHSPLL